jgi:UrcA family protein
MNVKTRISSIIATAMLLASASGVPNAFADDQVRSEKVSFSDLNVDTREGVQALYTRIHSAAKRVCSQSDPVMRAAVPACIAKAEGNAIEKVNLAQLTAYYKIKNNIGGHAQQLVAAR